MRTSILIIAFCIGIFSNVQSQNAQIKFSKSLHDFGTIKEEEGVKVYKFEFVNQGSAPLIIKHVTASCGCTSPKWTKAPIIKGKKGYIEVSFDPKNRPGPFNKSITINSNSVPNEIKLHIKGIVKERSKTIDDEYRYKMDGLMLQSNHIALTKILNTASKDEAIVLYNSLDKPMTVEFTQIPKHITFEKTKVVIPAKQKSYVEVTYDAKKKDDWGFVTDRVLITVNHKRNARNKLTISADIQEDFSKLSKQQLENAPQLKVEEKIFDFGTINEGEKLEHQFIFENTGKSDLIIRKIKSSCGCAVANMESKIIKAGAKSEIKVTFNSKGKSGKQLKTISFISNDPKNSMLTLRVKVNVLD